jgi:hypothetical protein
MRLRRSISRFVPQDWWTAAFIFGLAVAIVAVVGLVRSVPSGERAESTAPAEWPGSPRPPALSAPGALVSSEVRASGTIRVIHWIRAQAPISQIVVAVPDRPLPPGPPLARRVRVEEAGGTVLAVTSRVGSRPRALALSRPARLFRLTYELTGVVDRSASVTGRALAGVTFLHVDFARRTGPTEVTVTGSRVLNLGCVPTAADPVSRPCGAPDGQGWSVTLPTAERDGQVIAQLDLGQVSWASAS